MNGATRTVSGRLARAGGSGVVALAAVLACAPPVWAQTWSASTQPANGNIAGAAGTRIGWGYEIRNEDAANWLVLTAVGADAFQHGVAEVLFDLPIVAPSSSAARGFSGQDGLFALTWNNDAPIGFVNFGSFALSAEWWDGDPYAGGQWLKPAADVLLGYSAIVAVPELPPLAMLPLGLAMIALTRHRRQSRSALQQATADPVTWT